MSTDGSGLLWGTASDADRKMIIGGCTEETVERIVAKLRGAAKNVEVAGTGVELAAIGPQTVAIVRFLEDLRSNEDQVALLRRLSEGDPTIVCVRVGTKDVMSAPQAPTLIHHTVGGTAIRVDLYMRIAYPLFEAGELTL